jgi:hypothetical protein
VKVSVGAMELNQKIAIDNIDRCNKELMLMCFEKINGSKYFECESVTHKPQTGWVVLVISFDVKNFYYFELF